MYNMDITLLGYKLNVELLILIGVIYLILVGHTVCSCCNMSGIMEGLTTGSAKTQTEQQREAERAKIRQHVMAKMGSTKEGFVGANTNYGASASYNLSNDKAINTSSWMGSNLSVTPGKPLSAGAQSIINRAPQPIPLPEGEMLMFANTPFKPECCPNSYSNSTGCACMTTDQYNYLVLRGGNNVPYSEY